MDKQLIRLYIIIIVSYLLVAVFLPAPLYRTSSCLKDTVTWVNLFFYQNSGDKNKAPDKNKGSVIFVFDDGWDTQYTKGYEILKKYGMKANVAVIPTRVGKQGYMNYQQLAEVYMEGWDLLNQTYDHKNLMNLLYIAQEEEINRCREWLKRNLFDRAKDIVVFPGGLYNDQTFKVLEKNDYTAARSLESVWMIKNNFRLGEAEICSLASGASEKWADGFVDRAVENRSVVIFAVHKLEKISDDTEMQFEPERFESIVKYVYEKRDRINVLTFTEWLEYELGGGLLGYLGKGLCPSSQAHTPN